MVISHHRSFAGIHNYLLHNIWIFSTRDIKPATSEGGIKHILTQAIIINRYKREQFYLAI